MRILDRWVGRPLCGIVSGWTVAARLFGGRHQHREPGSAEQPRAILFIMLAEIGALVLTAPALRRARERFPHARLLFLTFPAGVEMLELMGFERGQIIVIDPAGLPTLMRSSFAALRRLRRERGLASVNFEVYSRFSTLIAFLSRARLRAGFHRFHEEGGYQGNLITQRVIYSPHHHMAASYVGLVEALSDPPGREPCAKLPAADVLARRLRLPADADRRAGIRAAIRRRLSSGIDIETERAKLIILNCNASDLVPLRRWPQERYVGLARRLLACSPHHVVVLTGSPAEAPDVAAMARRIGDARVVDLAGATSLRELIDLYNVASLMVTNDSGPAHFASTTELPTLVLYGPETPRIFGPLGPRQEAVYLAPLCSPCVNVYNQKRSTCTLNRCMLDISVDLVFDRCRRMLERSDQCDAD